MIVGVVALLDPWFVSVQSSPMGTPAQPSPRDRRRGGAVLTCAANPAASRHAGDMAERFVHLGRVTSKPSCMKGERNGGVIDYWYLGQGYMRRVLSGDVLHGGFPFIEWLGGLQRGDHLVLFRHPPAYDVKGDFIDQPTA